jgi:hypothetical protein
MKNGSHIQLGDTENQGGSGEEQSNAQRARQCAICDATDSVTQLNFTDQSGTESMIYLCPPHHRLYSILGQSQSPSPSPAKHIQTDQHETAKMTIRVPKPLLESTDTAAEQYQQTRSELVRDSLLVLLQLREVTDATDSLFSEAINFESDEQEGSCEADIEFLKDRVRKLESLLEKSIDNM